MFIDFRKRERRGGRDRERERERAASLWERNTDQLPPDQGSNPQPFGVQEDAPITEPLHQCCDNL